MPFVSIGVCVKRCSHHGKQHGRSSKLLTKELPWNPLTSLLGTESSFIISGGIGLTTKHRHQNLLVLESLHLSSLSKESTCADLISCRPKSPERRLYPSQLVKSLCAQIVDTEGPTVSLLLLFFLICLSVNTHSSNLQDPKGNHMFKWNRIQYP